MRNRPIRFETFLSKEEAQHLEHLQTVSGLSKSAIVRQLISGCSIKPRPAESYRELSRELSAIGNNLNQITCLANATGRLDDPQIQQVSAIMQQVWTVVHNTL